MPGSPAGRRGIRRADPNKDCRAGLADSGNSQTPRRAGLLSGPPSTQALSAKPSSKAVSSFGYVYIIVFFLLLSGLFQPLISGNDGDMLVAGVFVLLLGLLGGILLWKSSHDKNNRVVYMGLGFGLVAGSLTMVFLIA